MYEVFLGKKVIGTWEWRNFFERLTEVACFGEKVELVVRFEQSYVRFFVKTRRKMPYFLVGAEDFILVESEMGIKKLTAMPSFCTRIYHNSDSILTIYERLKTRAQDLIEMSFIFRKSFRRHYSSVFMTVRNAKGVRVEKLVGANDDLWNLDFRKTFILNKPPKYLDMSRSLQLVDVNEIGGILSLSTYPFLKGKHFLNLKNFDFYRHTAIFGASGSGKTKFLCNLITQIIKNYGDKYKVIMIDPHDAMRDEVGGVPGVRVFDFTNQQSGLKLFMTDAKDIINSVEMMLDLIKSLMGESYNIRLERLLRSCLYLLVEKGELDFMSLRRILTDTFYRDACLKEVGAYLPESLQEFFGQDFNEFKTQHYDVTFAPVLSLIDELQLTPAFYRVGEHELELELRRNKVVLVSLNQTKLGLGAVKTLAGLIMNQVFTLGLQRKNDEHIILVVDEVAVVESPILIRFLAEARKYNISVCLAGQYFSQVSEGLKKAMDANIANYFCFRLSYDDAEYMSKNMDLRLSANEQLDYRDGQNTFITSEKNGFGFEYAKFLASLADREVVAKVSRAGVQSGAIMGKSLDFEAVPEELRLIPLEQKTIVTDSAAIWHGVQETENNLQDLMREQSTGRRMN